MHVQLGKLSGHHIVPAGELLGAQPQGLVPEVIINRRKRRGAHQPRRGNRIRLVEDEVDLRRAGQDQHVTPVPAQPVPLRDHWSQRSSQRLQCILDRLESAVLTAKSQSDGAVTVPRARDPVSSTPPILASEDSSVTTSSGSATPLTRRLCPFVGPSASCRDEPNRLGVLAWRNARVRSSSCRLSADPGRAERTTMSPLMVLDDISSRAVTPYIDPSSASDVPATPSGVPGVQTRR
jgi:hypothetical protein